MRERDADPGSVLERDADLLEEDVEYEERVGRLGALLA